MCGRHRRPCVYAQGDCAIEEGACEGVGRVAGPPMRCTGRGTVSLVAHGEMIIAWFASAGYDMGSHLTPFPWEAIWRKRFIRPST